MVGKRRPGRFTLKNERELIASNCVGDRRQIQDVRQDDRAEGQSARKFDKRCPRATRREMKPSWVNPLARALVMYDQVGRYPAEGY